MAGVTFTLLYLWPFLEARFTKDRDEHHLLDRPRDRPVRTAIGVGVLSFYVVLLLAGGAFTMSGDPGGETLALPNFGLETVHHVHADDVAQIFMQAMANRSVAIGESFHTVSPAPASVRRARHGVAGHRTPCTMRWTCCSTTRGWPSRSPRS